MANFPRRPKGQEQKVADPRRGKIYLWFDTTAGHEIKKTRPALVMNATEVEAKAAGLDRAGITCILKVDTYAK